MDAQKVDMYLTTHAKYFEAHQVNAVRDKLLAMDDSRWTQLLSLDLKDPISVQIVSLIGGMLGIDRFMIGDTGLGVAKLITCGGLYIWGIVDWFMIMGRTREINAEKFFNNLA